MGPWLDRRSWLAGALIAACAGSASGQVERDALERLGRGARIIPQRVAAAAIADGRVQRVGEWQQPGSAARWWEEPVFDCFGDEDRDHLPDDSVCGMGSDRWFLGTRYCNTFVTNDMTLLDCTSAPDGLGAADVAWYWGCGAGGSERCVIAVFTAEESVAGCGSSGPTLSGWLFDFGEVACNPDDYYFALLEPPAEAVWEVPSDLEGSYSVYFLRDDQGTPATCAQPMLWGAWCGTGGSPRHPGSQEPAQFDDTLAPFGVHTPEECADYAWGVCPDPLGAMVQFWGVRYSECGHGATCDYADCNRDGRVRSDDLICYLGLWASDQEFADCDDDCVIDTRDLICYLQYWSVCRDP